MNETEIILNVVKVFGLAAVSFFIALLWTPLLTHILYKYRLWRKEARTTAPDGSATPLFHELHKEREVRAPRMGGLLIWVTTIFVAFAVLILADMTGSSFLSKLNFVSRNQTWLPLFTLFAAAMLGLVDDFLQVFHRGGYVAGGLAFWKRLFVVFIIACVGAYWFYFRLGQHSVFIPWFGDIEIGILFIPFFITTMFATFSTGVIDGLDGLAGGVFASIFAAYGGIAFFQNQIDLAAFSAVLLGSLLAFLWFNIPPARFYMGETGILGLTTTLTVIAFLTNSVIVLPIIAIVPVVEAMSVIIQLGSKRFFGRKIFLIAPLHHHFEAIGWPHYKITMRFWVISFVFAMMGMVIALIGR
ncbi:MAG: phospho-N-acetylmuramoyl-pentapeptide-transferase [bacterium]|nr:phospho-N-acetylmuramoyl-pentapeptide-transferase [bacterium]